MQKSNEVENLEMELENMKLSNKTKNTTNKKEIN